MFKNEYVLSVDIKKTMTTNIPIFVQYDNAELVFKIYDDGKPFDLTGFTSAEISHKRSDGMLVIGYGALETLPNGTKAIRYIYQGNEMSRPGFVSASLSLYSTNNRVSILPFKIEIIGDSYEDSIESSPEMDILQQLIASVSGVSGQATQAANSATQAANSATQAVTQATNAVTSANNAVTSANQAIVNANAAATNANAKAILADEKAALTNLAIANVNTAREATITTTNNAQTIVDNTRSVGTFTLSTAYLRNNIVTSNGSSWIALTNTQNNPLPVLPATQNTWWRILAEKGKDGANGGGSGTVTKINNIEPDDLGNITLTPTSLGAAPTTHAHTTAQVTGLDAALATKETITGSQEKVNTHATTIATNATLGHVRPDGTTITIDRNGVISSIGGGGTGVTTIEQVYDLNSNKSLSEIIGEINSLIYTPSTVTLNTIPNVSVREYGDNINSIVLSAVVAKKTQNVTRIEFYRGNTLLNTINNPNANGGTFTYTDNTAITDTVTYQARVYDVLGSAETTKTINYIYPFYAGSMTELTPTQTQIRALSKLIKTKSNTTHSFTTTNGRFVFAYPSSYGSLTSISDPNGFETIGSYTVSTISITGLNGTAVSYNLYVLTTVTTQTNFANTFRF